MGVPAVPTTEEDKQDTGDLGQQIMMEDDTYFLDFPRKKKMFSSSSFYEEPNAIYPTVEEQVEMCRKIADSLSDDCNKKSKGSSMFFKRVKKAEKWIVESNEYESDGRFTPEGHGDSSVMPYVRVGKGPTKLKLILDPRHIVDMESLRQEGIAIVEHNTVSPEICHDIVKDLNSPTGKGAQLFAKRKKKSEEWVVDEQKVRHLLGKQSWDDGRLSPDLPIKPLTHPRVQKIKAPWDKGNKVTSDDIVDSVIRAAEAKIMTYPSKRFSAIEAVASYEDTSYPSWLDPAYQRLSTPTPDAYMTRSPRGWMSGTPAAPAASIPAEPSNLLPKSTSAGFPNKMPSTSPTPYCSSQQSYPTSRTMSFTNFNTTAKAWSPAGQSSRGYIKPVRPPSVLLSH